jgi:hypothetical protein
MEYHSAAMISITNRTKMTPRFTFYDRIRRVKKLNDMGKAFNLTATAQEKTIINMAR